MRLKGFVLIEKDQKYLLIQEASEKWKGKWFLPGGSIRLGEKLEAGTLREVFEEAGCEVNLMSVFLVKRSHSFFNKKVSVFFVGQLAGDFVEKKSDKESLDVKWWSYDELINLPLRQNLKKIIEIYRSHKDFVAFEKFNLSDFNL
jgi:ADP-ribose pyrophosphatase